MTARRLAAQLLGLFDREEGGVVQPIGDTEFFEAPEEVCGEKGFEPSSSRLSISGRSCMVPEAILSAGSDKGLASTGRKRLFTLRAHREAPYPVQA